MVLTWVQAGFCSFFGGRVSKKPAKGVDMQTTISGRYMFKVRLSGTVGFGAWGFVPTRVYTGWGV